MANKTNMSLWLKHYELAKKYYEHYGDLNIDEEFKTSNGITYDIKGFTLGYWIKNNRKYYRKNKLNELQVGMLDEIEMIWNLHEHNWDIMYEQAVKFYEKHGNWIMTESMKTNKEIDKLYNWISSQRDLIRNDNLPKEKVKKLLKINIMNDAFYEKWAFMYSLCENYYEENGNLIMPSKFKTSNGVTYDADGDNLVDWLNTQRSAYKANNMHICGNRIDLLDELNIEWFKKTIDFKLQKEKITIENVDRKREEISNRARTCLNRYYGSSLPSKEEINKRMILELERKN